MTYNDLNVIVSDDDLMDCLNRLHSYHKAISCSSDVDFDHVSVKSEFKNLSCFFMASFRDKKRSL